MRRAACADGAPGTGQVAGEVRGLAALDARLQVREVPREPQELELERKCQRVERRAAAHAGRQRVQDGQEARHRLERALVPLLLDEEPEHRLRADEPDGEPIGILTRGPVRVDERRAGDRVQLS